jgi:hypothetical protein
MKCRFLYRFVLLAGMLLPGAAVLHAQDDYDDTDTAGIAVAPVLEEEQHITYQEKQHMTEPPVFREVPDSVSNRLKRQKDFAYANDPAYWAREKEDDEPKKDFWDYFYSFFSQVGVRMIMYGLLIAFFLFIIYRVIVVNNLYLFYRSKKVSNPVNADEGNIEDENLDEKINRAIDQQEHRMAVRYMYLKALRLLNDRQWIRFHTQATNYEYVHQMSGHKMSPEFSFLTRIYDYVWYGEFPLTNEQFDLVHKNFLHFYNAVK